MSNPLTSPLPSSVVVGGEEIPVNTSHRVGIHFQEIVQRHISDSAKVVLALDAFYPTIPTDYTAAIQQMLWFFRCGKPEHDLSTQRVYDFAHDYDTIYASFMQSYGVDLLDTATDLHWWRFMAMLSGLPDDSPFMKVVGYRQVKIPAKAPKEQREFYAKMKRLHALPSEQSEMSIDDIYKAKFGVERPLP